MRGRLLAKLGERDGSLSNLRRAVDISRTLSEGNPENVERRVAVASALIERADSAVLLSRQAGRLPDDRATAERDYVEAVEILSALKDKGEIEGTDVDTLNEVRSKLDALRAGK